MAIPLSASGSPLVFDTLSAVGVRHFHGASPRIYTQARAYFLQDDLQLSLAAFEREPAPGSRMVLALGGEGKPLLLLTLAPKAVALGLCAAPVPGLWQPAVQALAPPGAEFFAGVDEQGWYWGARVALPAGALALAGVRAGGGAFPLAVFKCRQGSGDYGASFAPQDPARPLDAGGFPRYEAVPY